MAISHPEEHLSRKDRNVSRRNPICFWQPILVSILACLPAAAQSGSYDAVSVRSPALGSPAGGSGDSGAPVISPDGRFVVFASAAINLVEFAYGSGLAAHFPAPLNVYLRDLSNAVTELISVDFGGTDGGDANSLPAQISTNGRFVLLESSASNLIPNDTNGASDVFVRDRESGTTLLVSRAISGGCGNGASYAPAMTPDGRYVVFASAATDLVPDDTNGIPDIYVRDLNLGTTTLVSVGAQATAAGPPDWISDSESPEITPDGRYVLFRSTATNLVAGVTNSNDIYVRDLETSTTYWVSSNAQQFLQPPWITSAADSFNQRISANGQVIAFEVCSVAPATNAFVLRHHVLSGTTDLIASDGIPPVPTSEPALQNLDITPDGRFIAFLARTNGNAVCVRRWDAQTGTSELVSGTLNNMVPAGTICEWPVMDVSGRYVAFLSDATELTTNAFSGGFHLYLRDMEAGITRLIDVGSNGLPAGVEVSAVPALSDNGSRVAFTCPDGPLVENDDNHDTDVFLKDLSTGAIELLSAHHPDLASLTPNAPSTVFDSCISSNGELVVFVSDADNLVPDDTNGLRDVFVRDLTTGTNILVTASTNGGSADGISTGSAISGNGRYVVFTSYADNLVDGDTNRVRDVFVRDLQERKTRLVSLTTNGVSPGNGDSFSPMTSDDGRYVLFWSMAQNLSPYAFVRLAGNVFLRDTVSGTNYLLSESYSTITLASASMTRDGHYVVFIGAISHNAPPMLYVWDTEQEARIYTNSATFSYGSAVSISSNGTRLAYLQGDSALLYVDDRVMGTNRLVTSGPFPSQVGLHFSSDGRFLAYATIASNTPSDGNSLSDVYLYDFQSDANILVSRSISTGEAADGKSDSPDVSPDGRFVAYRSTAADIVPGDENSSADIFLYDCLTGVNALLSANRFCATSADNRSSSPKFSADGKRLLWTSWASDQIGSDFNHFGDVFAFTLPPSTFVDDDHDGMDDQWELDYFKTTARDGTGDDDHDGASDLFEFQTGTNPTNATSLFRAEIVFTAAPSSSEKLTWTAAPGKGYRVQWKDSLSDPDWNDLNSPISVLGATGTTLDPVPTANQRFYRINLVTPQP